MVALLVAAAFLPAQNSLTNQERYAEFKRIYNLARYRVACAEVDREIDSIKARKPKGKIPRRRQKQALRAAKKRRAAVVYPSDVPTMVLDEQMNILVGLIGKLGRPSGPASSSYRGTKYVAASVMGKSDMLVYATHEFYRSYGGRVFSGSAFARNGRLPAGMPAGNAVNSWNTSRLVWVKGLPTSGIVDGSQVDLASHYFEVVGTQTYETAGGASSTVFVLQPFDMTGIDP